MLSSALSVKIRDAMDNATYLGDGLYVTHTAWEVELYAHNGIEKTNRVFLDPPTLRAFSQLPRTREAFTITNVLESGGTTTKSPKSIHT
jgi:hypothetical protein